jgi:hypothetical protein
MAWHLLRHAHVVSLRTVVTTSTAAEASTSLRFTTPHGTHTKAFAIDCGFSRSPGVPGGSNPRTDRGSRFRVRRLFLALS